MDPTKQSQALVTTVDCNQGMIAQVVLALLFCAAAIILETRHLILNQVPRPSPIAVLFAVGCLVPAIRFRNVLLKLALAWIGDQELTRIILAKFTLPTPSSISPPWEVVC